LLSTSVTEEAHLARDDVLLSEARRVPLAALGPQTGQCGTTGFSSPIIQRRPDDSQASHHMRIWICTKYADYAGYAMYAGFPPPEALQANWLSCRLAVASSSHHRANKRLGSYTAYYLERLKSPDSDDAYHSLIEADHAILPLLIKAYRTEAEPTAIEDLLYPSAWAGAAVGPRKRKR
jgi:hypothetical protein